MLAHKVPEVIEKAENGRITVIDSIMGSGKTSYAIQFMKENPLTSFIYITPFLSEVERIKTALPDMDFKEPSTTNKDGTKLSSLKFLLLNGNNIASTHALFKRCDEEVLDLLKAKGYVLILDECMDVVEQINIVKKDIEILLDSKTIIEENHWIKWVGTGSDYNGKFRDVMEQCFCNNVYHYSDRLYIWTFPIDIFRTFDKVFILTYMFDGQLQKTYFDLFNAEYEYKSVKADGKGYYTLTDYYKPDLSEISILMNIYEGNLNSIGDEPYSLSTTYLQKLKEKQHLAKAIQNNIYNYVRNIVPTKADKIMWTTIKEAKPLLKGDGYTKKFVPCNSRATNEYRERTTLVYVCNRYTQPHIKNFFKANGVEVNEDSFALSELVQWIFRSAIREGKPISIYIPSKRMRTLLKNWLEK